jgi:hypothetical protein
VQLSIFCVLLVVVAAAQAAPTVAVVAVQVVSKNQHQYLFPQQVTP